MEARTGDETHTARLIAHPANAHGPATDVAVHFDRRGADLWLRYVVEGDVDGIRWPMQATPGRADNLWVTTCFEAFVETTDGYVEYNLSSSGQWASYRFEGYRSGKMEASETVVVAGLDGASDMVALEGTIALPPVAGRLGLSAVIQAEDGSTTYWALAHPSDRPDFHHPDSFDLTLPPVEPA
jgi:hypothetical protein